LSEKAERHNAGAEAAAAAAAVAAGNNSILHDSQPHGRDERSSGDKVLLG